MTPQSPLSAGEMAQKHLGIITQRCLHYWWLLPPTARFSYDVDDMIAPIALARARSFGLGQVTAAKISCTSIWYRSEELRSNP